MILRCFAVACSLLVATAHAETRYVTDKLSVELRRGPSTEYLIIRSVEAGAPVEVLEQTPDGYSRVRLPGPGTEGFILTRFLTNETSARDRLGAAERNLTAARNRVSELEQQVAELSAQLGTTKSELGDTRANHAQVSQELANLRTAAANVVEIQNENESLRKRVVERDRQVNELAAQNRVLADRSRESWFLVGAGVLFAGIVVGLVAPTLRRRRRSDW